MHENCVKPVPPKLNVKPDRLEGGIAVIGFLHPIDGEWRGPGEGNVRGSLLGVKVAGHLRTHVPERANGRHGQASG
ncbi:MAG: hypothetical protein IPI91_03955 [Flavobacteriales bacterium]|nr:hypothetical protein [Flavobacteriales bacterium]